MVDVPHKTIADPRTHYGDGPAGTRSFVVQRVTGAINVVLTTFLIWFVVTLAGAGRESLVAAVRSPMVWVPLAVLLINVSLHMRIGMREVIEDYVHEPKLNRFSLMANTYVSLLVAVVGLLALLKLVIWG